MNTISMTDFWNLVDGQNCLLFDGTSEEVEEDLTDDEVQEVSDESSAGFEVTVVDNGAVRKKSSTKYTGIAKKIDFDKANKSKTKTRKLGELIVLNMLVEEAKSNDLKQSIIDYINYYNNERI